MSSYNLLKIVRLLDFIEHDAKLTFEDIHLQIVLKIINEEHQLIPKLKHFTIPTNLLLSIMAPKHLQVKLNFPDVNKESEELIVFFEDFRWKQEV